MSIQNVLTAALFKRDEEGRTVVFPNGVMGRGYVVPDAATEQKMRRSLMWLIITSGLVGGVGMQIMLALFGQVVGWTAKPWGITVAALLAIGIVHWIVAAQLARGMTPAGQRLGVVEALKRQAEAMPRWYLGLMVIVAALMVAGSAVWMVVGTSMAKYLLGLCGIGLFGVLMMQAVHGLTHRPQT